jgi:HlyD family secretion protein
MKKKTLIIIVSTVTVIVVLTLVANSCKKSVGNYSFETAKVVKGDISNTVTATGTIEAIKTVQVGTQVSGVIKKIYVDFNSRVKKNQLLAMIDETPLLAALAQSQAAVDNAKAQLDYQTANYSRSKVLFEKNLLAQTDFDLATFNYNSAKANLDNAKSVDNKNKINLEYASITSPIDGVILNRAVDEGQTVAASFNTPTLFSIANDLTQMQVEAAVDEADIGQVKEGQKVEFTVDAYTDLKFAGKVTQIRLQPVVTSNVVTYTVIIQAPNPDQKLMPGMTANSTIIIAESKNTLLVPGLALRFAPDKDMLQSYFKTLPDSERPKGMRQDSSMWNGRNRLDSSMRNGRNRQDTTRDKMGRFNNEKQTAVWIKNGSIIHRKHVETGISDGSNVEVKTGLNEGDEIILSMSSSATANKKAALARSPFMPQRPGSTRR